MIAATYDHLWDLARRDGNAHQVLAINEFKRELGVGNAIVVWALQRLHDAGFIYYHRLAPGLRAHVELKDPDAA